MQTGRNTPGCKSLRKGRFSQADRAYLLTFVTHKRIPWFADLYLARIVVNALRKANHQETICYVVMPDHVHWLVVLNKENSLSHLVRAAKGCSAYLINKHVRHSGKFWQAGFHDHAIRDEESLIDVARYIVANPIRAGLCERIEMYPHWDSAWISGRG